MVLARNRGLPWDLLYADDLVLVTASLWEFKEKLIMWRASMESKGFEENKSDVERGDK